MADFQVGVARREITPKAEWIAGGKVYGWGFERDDRLSPLGSVRDPLYVTALAVSDVEGHTVVLATLDAGNLAASTTAAVRARVTADTAIPGANVCLNVSHTHAAPTIVELGAYWREKIGVVFEPYRQYVEDQTVAAITEAWNARTAATLHFGRGTTQIGGERLSKPYKPSPDQTLDVLHARRLDGRPLATVFRASCHPVWIVSPVVSADFVGVARAELGVRHGVTMFAQGFAGTCNPNSLLQYGHDSIPGMEDHGKRLAADVDAVMATLGQANGMTRLSGTVRGRSHTVTHPYQNGAASLPQEVQALSIGDQHGDWCLIACAHEVTTDLHPPALRTVLRERVTFAGYSNDQQAYVASDALVERGEYEGHGSNWYYGHVSNGAPDKLSPGVDDRMLGGIITVVDPGWQHMGHAITVVGLAGDGNLLYCATANDLLWRRAPTIGDVPWESLGHASTVVGLAAIAGELFCATRDGGLWVRSNAKEELPWQRIGGAEQVVAMTAHAGQLYCVTGLGGLWRRSATHEDLPWTGMGSAPAGVVGLAVARERLIAATASGLFWRSLASGAEAWTRFGAVDGAVGLTALGDRLYCVTNSDKLWTRPL